MKLAMKRAIKPWRIPLLYSLPAALAIAIAMAVNAGLISDLLFVGHFEISLGGVVLFVGVVLTVGLGLRGFLTHKSREREKRILDEVREDHAQAQRSFLQRLDHELKNPLTIIQLGLANLQPTFTAFLEDHQQQSFTHITEQTTRLQRLVEDLRRLGELEETTLERENVDLSAVLEEVVHMMRTTASSRRLMLNVRQIPWKLSPICGDRDLLEVALFNLLDNAIKYTPSDGTIEIRATEDGSVAVIEIADTGIGIQSDELPHVYEELYRGGNARQFGGSGLGMAMVKRIVDLHQGQITISSRPDEGTVITLRLPLASPVRN